MRGKKHDESTISKSCNIIERNVTKGTENMFLRKFLLIGKRFCRNINFRVYAKSQVK